MDAGRRGEGDGLLFYFDFRGSGSDAGGCHGEAERAGGLGAAGYGGGGAAEEVHFGFLERTERGGVAVGGGLECSGSVDLEPDGTGIGGYYVAVLVSHLHGEIHKVVAIGLEGGAVRGHDEVVGLSGSAHHLGLGGIARGIVCHDLELAGLVDGLVPHQAVAVLDGRVVLLAHALRLAVNEELGLGIGGVDEYGGHLTLAPFPVPVGKHMERGGLLVPARAVEIVAVFGERGEVDDAEDRTVAGPCVGVVGRGLAEIVEPGPYELADDPGVVVVAGKVEVGGVAPRA